MLPKADAHEVASAGDPATATASTPWASSAVSAGRQAPVDGALTGDTRTSWASPVSRAVSGPLPITTPTTPVAPRRSRSWPRRAPASAGVSSAATTLSPNTHGSAGRIHGTATAGAFPKPPITAVTVPASPATAAPSSAGTTVSCTGAPPTPPEPFASATAWRTASVTSTPSAAAVPWVGTMTASFSTPPGPTGPEPSNGPLDEPEAAVPAGPLRACVDDVLDPDCAPFLDAAPDGPELPDAEDEAAAVPALRSADRRSWRRTWVTPRKIGRAS